MKTRVRMRIRPTVHMQPWPMAVQLSGPSRLVAPCANLRLPRHQLDLYLWVSPSLPGSKPFCWNLCLLLSLQCRCPSACRLRLYLVPPFL